MASDHGSGGCEKGYYLADCFGLRLLNRRGCFPKFDLFIEQTKDIWKDMLDIRKRFEPRAEELAKKYALAPYTMFIGSGAVGRDDPVLDVHPRGDAVEAHPLHHLGRLLPRHPRARGARRPGLPVHGRGREPQARRARPRFLTRGVTGDTDINIIDTAEFAIPGLDDEFRVIVSPWILTVLVTDRLARYYETVTKHNLKYRRYYHQFDY